MILALPYHKRRRCYTAQQVKKVQKRPRFNKTSPFVWLWWWLQFGVVWLCYRQNDIVWYCSFISVSRIPKSDEETNQKTKQWRELFYWELWRRTSSSPLILLEQSPTYLDAYDLYYPTHFLSQCSFFRWNRFSHPRNFLSCFRCAWSSICSFSFRFFNVENELGVIKDQSLYWFRLISVFFFKSWRIKRRTF